MSNHSKKTKQQVLAFIDSHIDCYDNILKQEGLSEEYKSDTQEDKDMYESIKKLILTK